MLTYAQIVSIAAQAAHSPGATTVALQFLNSIQTELCQTYDFAEARGQFFFTFNPALVNPNAAFVGSQFGSGPYNMPLDYLRLSGSSGATGSQRSFIWWLLGVPYPVIPVDLAEFDLQIQQSGLQSYVWLAATDMSAPTDDRILLTTTGTLTATTTTVPVASTTRLIATGAIGVGGQGVVPGTTVTAITGNNVTFSTPPSITLSGASLMFGYPPQIFIYPPPSSAQPAMIRYQRQMPPITDTSRYPWCHQDNYWIEKLTGYLCMLNDDDRAAQLLGGPDAPGSPDNKLHLYLAAKDDDASHAKTVQLDRRRFGTSMRTLPNTKTIGW